MPHSHDECIFCQIIAGSAPASFVYQDEVCSAFMDIFPVNPGHLLIVPNRHATYLNDMDEETAGHLMKAAHPLAQALRDSGLPCEAVNLFLADGEEAGQEVFHSHLHIIPRFRGDNFRVSFGPGRAMAVRRDLDEISARLAAQLKTGA